MIDRELIRSWASQSSHLIGDCFDHATPMLDQGYAGLPPLVRFVAAQLFIDCHLSSESVLLLLCAEKEWDADLLVRSVLEGSLKLTYMLRGTEREVSTKVNEYWNVLPLFSAIRRSEDARRLLDRLSSPLSPEWRPFHDLLLGPRETAQVRQDYSREDRRAIQERWSFTGICRDFATSGEPALGQLVGLAHGYGMSSHLLHKDADGIGMVWERCRRESDRLDAVRLAHAARIVSDVCSFAKLRLHALLRACGARVDVLLTIEKRYEALAGGLKQANDDFTRTEYRSDNQSGC
jgi:hypothetical protein